jgi:uncharacterized protein (UPF0147 family)
MNQLTEQSSRNIDIVLNEQKQLTAQIELLTAYENLYLLQNKIATSSYQIRDSNSLKILEEIFNDPLIQNKPNEEN